MNKPSLHSPFKEPDWRSRRACHLVEDSLPPSDRDDHWTWQAWRFFHGLARCHDDEQRQLVRRYWPQIAAAVELRKNASDIFRWELEARLLARESMGVVAERFGLAPEAVQAYVMLFFDVLDYLKATYFIVLQVIGLTPSRDFTEKDVEVWLKFFGYSGGPLVLDSVLDYYRRPEPIPTDLTQVDPLRRARISQQLTIRASILLQCIRDGDVRMLAVESLVERLEAQRRHWGPVGEGDGLPPIRLSPARWRPCGGLGVARKRLWDASLAD